MSHAVLGRDYVTEPHAAPEVSEELGVKLGGMPPTHDYADEPVKLATFTDRETALDVTHPYFGWATGVTFQMFKNDELGCCTCTGVANGELVFSRRGDHPETPTDADVLDFFDLTGKREGLDRSQGRFPGDVLDAWRDVGFKQEAGDPDQAVGEREKIVGWAAVDPRDEKLCWAAGYTFLGLFLSLALPVQAAYQWQAGQRWSTLGPGNTTPGSWGYHFVYMPAHGYNRVIVATWAKRQEVSIAWWRKYVYEVRAVWSPDISDRGVASNGMDAAKLRAAMQELG